MSGPPLVPKRCDNSQNNFSTRIFLSEKISISIGNSESSSQLGAGFDVETFNQDYTQRELLPYKFILLSVLCFFLFHTFVCFILSSISYFSSGLQASELYLFHAFDYPFYLFHTFNHTPRRFRTFNQDYTQSHTSELYLFYTFICFKVS